MPSARSPQYTKLMKTEVAVKEERSQARSQKLKLKTEVEVKEEMYQARSKIHTLPQPVEVGGTVHLPLRFPPLARGADPQ